MDALLRPLSFLMIMLGAYALKHIGFFRDQDADMAKKVVFNLTLPAAVLHAFSGLERDPSLFVLVLFGLACSVLPILLMFVLTRGQKTGRRAFFMINSAGYNIGSFAMPLVQNMFGAPGAAVACMFDTGNAVMQSSGAYTLTSAMLSIRGKDGREGFGMILRKFFTSVAFDSYMLMLLLTALDLKLPDFVLTLTAPIASANSFFSMVMVGLMFRPFTQPGFLKDALRVIAVRLLFSAAFAALFYFVTPFPLLVRQVLAVVCFAPISSLSPANTERCLGDGSLASLTNSLSVIVALVIMTTLMVLMTGGI